MNSEIVRHAAVEYSMCERRGEDGEFDFGAYRIKIELTPPKIAVYLGNDLFDITHFYEFT